MSDLEVYIKTMQEHHCQALKQGKIDFANGLEFCILTAKEFLKNIKGEK